MKDIDQEDSAFVLYHGLFETNLDTCYRCAKALSEAQLSLEILLKNCKSENEMVRTSAVGLFPLMCEPSSEVLLTIIDLTKDHEPLVKNEAQWALQAMIAQSPYAPINL